MAADLPLTARRALDAAVARRDPEIVGLVLSGSAARARATTTSDVDVYAILADGAAPRPTTRSPEIDWIPISLATLEDVPPFGTEGWWQRWSFAWSVILRDDTDGRITEAVRRQATLSPAEQRAVLLEHERLDGYLNLAYRALKSNRAGRPFPCRLDAAEAVPWLLDTLFALAGRVRPYNGYLEWELTEHPIDGYEPGVLLPIVEGHLSGDPGSVQAALVLLRGACAAWDRRAGGVELARRLDDWADELGPFGLPG